MNFRDYNEKCPRYIYMYISKIEYLESNVVNGRFHVEMPSKFNDIFDSAFTMNEDDFKRVAYTESAIERFVYFTHRDYKTIVKEVLYKNMDHSKRFCDALEMLYESNVDKQIIDEAIKCVLKHSSNMQAYNNKIACFTELNDSVLMWAHYGNNMQGM